MFRYTNAANDTANITTPVLVGSRVFVTSAYNTGGALLQLRAENGEVKADEVGHVDGRFARVLESLA